MFISDDEEKEVMVHMFEFAKDMISLNLTENELALLCAVVLIDPSKYCAPSPSKLTSSCSLSL